MPEPDEFEEAAAESFQPDAHPRATSGPAGGQFTTGGSPATNAAHAGGKAAKAAAGKRKPGAPAKAPAAPLSFDGKTGTGYGTPHGDPRVHELQGALNALGVTDAQGKPLTDDGKLGPRTTTAVRKLQSQLGMKPDGVVTPELLGKVKALAAAKKSPKPKAPPAAKHAKEAEERVLEGVDHIEGQVLEAVGTANDGGRIFRVRIIREGTSKNRKRYTEAVLRNAAPLYEGAKAFDHHRTPAEMATSTVAGLVGGYRNVAYETDGLYGDLVLLPSAQHTAEALDASISAQAAGLPPLVGISHDVLASFRPGVPTGGRHVQEAVAITRVHSADVVADPSAGGQATRVLAGGTEEESEEAAVPLTAADIDAIAAAVLERVQPQSVTESTDDVVEHVAEAKTSFLASFMIASKLKEAGLPEAVRESITAALPEWVTEADIDAHVGAYKTVAANLERTGLAPTVTVQVTQEAQDKKVKALDAFFNGDFHNGYRSFRGAYEDFTGYRGRAIGTEDFNRQVLRESFAADYEYRSDRTTESLSATTWNLALGDSITRRLIAQYNRPGLNWWMDLVSSMPPVNDFRTQRIDRIGGYGLLPAVNQGAAYQPLTSPANEEVTYAITKRGGTEDITLEMIANDDIRAISQIPYKLGLAAQRTIFDFVLELLRPSTANGPFGTAGNATIYDSTALYAAGHANTTTTVLSQTALSASRAKMRQQAAYGDTQDILSATPKYLLVPPTLEELAFQLCTSAVAIPATPAGASNTPNLHSGLEYKVIDYWDALSSTQWALVADPNTIPTIEIGFYQGQREPALFQQSDPTVGSMFNADKFTWKIRHIYSGAVLDYRSFQRGNS